MEPGHNNNFDFIRFTAATTVWYAHALLFFGHPDRLLRVDNLGQFAVTIFFTISGYFFQGLRPTDDNRSFPVPLPLLEYTYIPEDHLLDGQFRFDLSSVALTRDVGTDDQRVSAEMRWRKPWVTGNGMLVKRPFVIGTDVALTGFDPKAWAAWGYLRRPCQRGWPKERASLPRTRSGQAQAWRTARATCRPALR